MEIKITSPKHGHRHRHRTSNQDGQIPMLSLAKSLLWHIVAIAFACLLHSMKNGKSHQFVVRFEILCDTT